MSSQQEYIDTQAAAFRTLEETPLLQPTFFDVGLGLCRHNMPCAVYTGSEHAMLDGSTGVFQPSGKARKEGWVTVQAKTKFQKWLIMKFFKE